MGQICLRRIGTYKLEHTWSHWVLVVATLIMAGVFAGLFAAARTAHARSPATSTRNANKSVDSTPTATPDCSAAWRIVNSPSPSLQTNYLFGVTAISANDVWAVGAYNIGNGTYWTLALHWDGNQWSQIPSPNPYPGSGSTNYFAGAATASANDLWAVGFTHPYGEPWLTLTEHWNGTQWSVVPSPSAGVSTNYLYGVSAVSANDVWAAGYYRSNTGADRTLVEHWDGGQWSIVASPNVGSSSNELLDIEAIASNDVWAVGYYGSLTLVEHWNGGQWSLVPSPNPAQSIGPILYGVSATSSNDVWAVGSYGSTDGTNNTLTLIEHWDGSQWSLVPSPNLGGSGTNLTNELRGVSAFSQNDAWAVGYFCCTVYGSITMVQQWDGVQWSVMTSPNPSVTSNLLFGIAAISSNDVWAVGYYGGFAG